MDIVLNSHPMDPAEAAKALVQRATSTWLEGGDYMDDITAVVIFLDKEGTNNKNIDLEAGASSKDAAADTDGNTGLPMSARFWTLLAGFLSGFLGGLCGIRGPPLILYMLHKPKGVSFTKESQRATGAAITAVNVIMRIVYYLMDTFAFGLHSKFHGGDWGIYLAVGLLSLLGVLVGSEIFERLKDSKNTIRAVLTCFLLMCGASLLISSFASV